MTHHDLSFGGEIGQLRARIGEGKANGLGDLRIESLTVRFEVLQNCLQGFPRYWLNTDDTLQDIPIEHKQSAITFCG